MNGIKIKNNQVTNAVLLEIQKHPNKLCLLTYWEDENTVSRNKETSAVVSGEYLYVERDPSTAPCGTEFGRGITAFNFLQNTPQPLLWQLLQTHIRAPKRYKEANVWDHKAQTNDAH